MMQEIWIVNVATKYLCQDLDSKKLSRLVTGQAQDSIIPIEMYLCTQCGKALQELLPLELRDKPSSIVE